jgi:hypothetical protein
VRMHQPLVGGGGAPFALDLEVGGEGAPQGMLCFFSVVSPGAFGFGTALRRFADEIGRAVPRFMFVLVVFSLGLFI